VKRRVPDPGDLALEPQLGPLLLLEIAAALVASALRARHLPIAGDPAPDELADEAAARRVVLQSHRLLRAVRAYRRPILDRLARDQAAWFDPDD
jgi:hypothetical protein